MINENLCPAPPEMATDLPKEVVVEILLQLPVESMMRFKSVCKSWYALFKNPSFVSRHLANQSKDHHVFYNRSIPPHVQCNISSIISSDGVYYDVDLPSSYKECRMLVVGHCDGIVAISHHGTHHETDYVTVCNFATRDFRTLPNSSFHPYPKNYGYAGPPALHAETDAVGFGYDHKTKDYKLVRVVAFWEDSYQNIWLHSRAEVFSLGTDSSWREINSFAAANIEACSNIHKTDHMEHYLDGVWYWWAYGIFGSGSVLVSFNFADEVFQKAPLPDMCDSSRMNFDYNYIHLGVYNNESMALFVYPHPLQGAFDKCIDVWVMKEFSVKESWTKQLTIGPLPTLGRPLAFWKNNTELLYEDSNGQLVSCDLVTLEYKSFNCYGFDFYSPNSAAVSYMKTLVSINTREYIAA